MGTPVPWPSFSDNDCTLCTPVLFPPGQTPIYVTLTVSGVLACPGAPLPAPNGIWILRQRADLHCYWRLYSSGYAFQYGSGAAGSSAVIQLSPGFGTYFSCSLVARCKTLFTNQSPGCDPPAWIGGLGTIAVTWP